MVAARMGDECLGTLRSCGTLLQNGLQQMVDQAAERRIRLACFGIPCLGRAFHRIACHRRMEFRIRLVGNVVACLLVALS